MFDTETTGKDPDKCQMLTLSGYLFKDKKRYTFDFRVQPFDFSSIEQEAIDVTGINYDKIMEYHMEPIEGYFEIVKFFSAHGITPFYSSKTPNLKKAYGLAYNAEYDKKVLTNFFVKARLLIYTKNYRNTFSEEEKKAYKDNYKRVFVPHGSLFVHPLKDVLQYLAFKYPQNNLKFENMKLTTVSKALGITDEYMKETYTNQDWRAHDSLSDVQLMEQILLKTDPKFFEAYPDYCPLV